MKKQIISTMLVVAMTLNLVACGSTSTTTSDSATGTSTSPSSTATETSTPKTFTSTAVGYHGDVTLDVTITGQEISDIQITHTETEGLGSVALANMTTAVLDGQTLNIDGMTGATLSSTAFMTAIEDCLTQGGLDVAALKTKGGDVAQADDIELTTTTLVVGGGLSGLTTALKLASMGEEVLIIERAEVLGGATLTAHGYFFGVESQPQKDAGIEDSVETFLELVKVSGKGLSDLAVAEMVAEQSGYAVDWIMSLGLGVEEEIGVGAYYPHNVDRVYTADGNGAAMIKVLTDAMEEFIDSGKVEIMMSTEATSLLTNDQGVVTGAVATGKTGNTVTINATTTVLATGGYGHNEELLNKYQFENVITSAPVSHTGLGMQMLEELGAEMVITPLAGQAGGIPNNGFDKGMTFNTNQYPGVIWTNVDGDRLANETGTNNALVWKQAPENTVYMVFTDSMITDEKPLFIGVPVESTQAKLDELVDGGFAIKADSAEALATATGLTNLAQTIETYNGYCTSGTDADFGKTDGLVSFEDGTYYAIKTYPFIVQTTDGIKNNLDRQPVTADGSPIDGVYIVGDMVGMNILTGGTAIGGAGLTPAITTGIQVAEQIADKE